MKVPLSYSMAAVGEDKIVESNHILSYANDSWVTVRMQCQPCFLGLYANFSHKKGLPDNRF